MWDGVQFPVTCRGHRHVSQSCANAKEKAPDLKKWRFRGLVPRKNIGIMPELINQSKTVYFRHNMHNSNDWVSCNKCLWVCVCTQQIAYRLLVFKEGQDTLCVRGVVKCGVKGSLGFSN